MKKRKLLRTLRALRKVMDSYRSQTVNELDEIRLELEEMRADIKVLVSWVRDETEAQAPKEEESDNE